MLQPIHQRGQNDLQVLESLESVTFNIDNLNFFHLALRNALVEHGWSTLIIRFWAHLACGAGARETIEIRWPSAMKSTSMLIGWLLNAKNYLELFELEFHWDLSIEFRQVEILVSVDSFHLGTRNFPIFTVLPAAKPVGANGGDKVSVTWVTGFQMLFFPSWCRWFLVATHPSQVAVGPSACTSTALIPARGTMRSISSSSPWRVFYFRPTQKTAQARKKK